ncbi:MAG: hypothetical protein U0641_00310 [Anaerolineae bacterium]
MKRLFALAIALVTGLVWTGIGQAQGNVITRFDILKSDGSSVCTGSSAQRVCTVPSGSKDFSVVVEYQNLPANTQMQLKLADAVGNEYSPPSETHSGNGSVTWKVTGDQLLANLRKLADPDQQSLGNKVQAASQSSQALSEAKQVVSQMRSPIQSLQRYGGLIPASYVPLDQADQALNQTLQALSASSPNYSQANSSASDAANQLKAGLSKFDGQTNIVLADDVPFSSSTRTANIELNGAVAGQSLQWTVSAVALPTATTQPTSRPVATESRPGNVPTRTVTPTPAPTQNNQQPTATTAPQSGQQPTATTAAQSSQQPTATTAPDQSSQQPTATTAPAQSVQQPTAIAAAQAASAGAAAAASAAGQSGGASVVTAAPPPPQATAIALGGQAAAAAAGATPAAAAQKAVGAAPSGATPNATPRPGSGTPVTAAQATATAAKLAGGVDLSRLTPEAGGASRVLGQAERGGFPLLIVGLVVVAAALGGAALWVRRRT